MKIYKPTFESFIDEAIDTVYVQEMKTEKQSDNLTINKDVFVAITGYNAEDHVLALMIHAGSYVYGDIKTQERVDMQADRIRTDVLSRLKALRIEVRPGLINDKILRSQPYKFTDPRLHFDLDDHIGTDIDGKPLAEGVPS